MNRGVPQALHREDLRLPASPLRLRLAAAGFETFEAACTGLPMIVTLRPASDTDGMVTVPAHELKELVAGRGEVSGHLDEFDVDTHEVTNAAYREFVFACGYSRTEFRTQPFIKDGRTLSWEEAMREFVDPTGRPGPSTSESGTYPSGQANDPAGVSWYEAAAYAEFAGKDLPTVHHWVRAANIRPSRFDEAQFIVPASNFQSSGPRDLRRSDAVGSFGAYDLGGNVREAVFEMYRSLWAYEKKPNRDDWELVRWVWDEELVDRLIAGFEKAHALHRSAR